MLLQPRHSSRHSSSYASRHLPSHAISPAIAFLRGHSPSTTTTIQQAIRNFDINYNVISFFRDLSKIRTQTFTKGNCMKAFRDSGIWPADYEKIEKKVAVYAKPELQETPKQANQAS